MAGWIVKVIGAGRHQVLRLDDETGDEELVGMFGAEVPLDDVMQALLARAEPGDWLVVNGEPMVVGEGN